MRSKMRLTPREAKLAIEEVKSKLPSEGQKWLDGMDSGELIDTVGILSRVGEESFLKYWPDYKQQLDKIRFDFWRPGSR